MVSALLSPTAGRGMLVQPQHAATVCEFDLVQYAISVIAKGSDLGSDTDGNRLLNPKSGA